MAVVTGRIMDADAAETDVLERVLGELTSLRAENQRLAARVNALESQSSGQRPELRASNAYQPDTADGDVSDTPAGMSRRRLLTGLAGAAAVGAAGASLASAPPAGATTGTMMFGAPNDSGTDPTSLTSSNAGTTLGVTASGTTSGIDAPSAIVANSTSTGVTASGGRYGVVASGAVDGAPLVLVPVPFSWVGPPTNGLHRIGEMFTDHQGALFQCVGAGTPGTWVRVGFNPLNPTRILDTRNSSPIGPNSSINLTVGGSFGVAAQASAIVVNATVTQGTAPSFLTIYPEGTTRPLASNLNWVAGQTVPNLVTVKLGAVLGITIYNASGTVDVVLDLAGFYS
jgi:hypothetical protein